MTINLNDEIGLGNTLKSVKIQDYKNFEHITIDGASSDGSVDVWRICCSSDSRFSITSEPDNGIYDAMNTGVTMVAGDLILILNAGDTLVNEKVFTNVAKSWIQDPDWSWGYGKLNFYSPQGIQDLNIKTPTYNFSSFRWGNSYVPHPSSFVSKNLFDKYGNFDPIFGIAADQEFFMRIAKDFSPKILNFSTSNFILGGAHSSFSPWHRERMWHLMRRKNKLLLLNSVVLDRFFAELLILWRSFLALYRRIREIQLVGPKEQK